MVQASKHREVRKERRSKITDKTGRVVKGGSIRMNGECSAWNSDEGNAIAFIKVASCSLLTMALLWHGHSAHRVPPDS